MVSERESRKVAEAAREGWQRPSFGKELFLGRLRLDLIHPYPRPTEQERRKGEAFLARLEAYLREAVDPLQIERDAKIPDEVVRGLGELGAFGIKIEERYGGPWPPRCTPPSACCSAPTSPSACPSRCGCSAARSRSGASCPASPGTR
jgi:hypothetical protein